MFVGVFLCLARVVGVSTQIPNEGDQLKWHTPLYPTKLGSLKIPPVRPFRGVLSFGVKENARSTPLLVVTFTPRLRFSAQVL